MTILSKIPAVFLCAALLLMVPATARAKQCASPKTIMAFKSAVTDTKYNVSESAFDIHNLYGGTHGAGLVTGLSLSPLSYEFEGLFKVTEVDGGFCIALDKMKMLYKAEPIVFISKELPRKSCEFKAVLRHENKHVRALKNVHGRTSSEFKAHVENSLERIRAIGPIPKSKIEAARDKMQDELTRLLDDYLKDVMAELTYEQNKIDSPSEYKRVNAECTEWSGRLRLE